MIATRKIVLIALFGTVLLSAAFADETSEPEKQVKQGYDGAINDFQELAQEGQKVTRDAAQGFLGLSSKIVGSVKNGAASLYSHLPFFGKQPQVASESNNQARKSNETGEQQVAQQAAPEAGNQQQVEHQDQAPTEAVSNDGPAQQPEKPAAEDKQSGEQAEQQQQQQSN